MTNPQELIEKIEECLKDIRDPSVSYLDPAKRDAYIEAEKLLDLALSALPQWVIVTDRLPIRSGSYPCKLSDGTREYICYNCEEEDAPRGWDAQELYDEYLQHKRGVHYWLDNVPTPPLDNKE